MGNRSKFGSNWGLRDEGEKVADANTYLNGVPVDLTLTRNHTGNRKARRLAASQARRALRAFKNQPMRAFAFGQR